MRDKLVIYEYICNIVYFYLQIKYYKYLIYENEKYKLNWFIFSFYSF